MPLRQLSLYSLIRYSKGAEEENMSDDAEIKIVCLAASYQAFGMVVDFLADSMPFGTFELSEIAPVLRGQLKHSHNLAALRGDVMVGYAGWLLTTVAIGTEWMENRAILSPMTAEDSDAAALTVFASDDRGATTRLIRGARELNIGRRVFFKRGYDGQMKPGRKATVLNAT
jgi:hypothetical protein